MSSRFLKMAISASKKQIRSGVCSNAGKIPYGGSSRGWKARSLVSVSLKRPAIGLSLFGSGTGSTNWTRRRGQIAVSALRQSTQSFSRACVYWTTILCFDCCLCKVWMRMTTPGKYEERVTKVSQARDAGSVCTAFGSGPGIVKTYIAIKIVTN